MYTVSLSGFVNKNIFIIKMRHEDLEKDDNNEVIYCEVKKPIAIIMHSMTQFLIKNPYVSSTLS